MILMARRRDHRRGHRRVTTAVTATVAPTVTSAIAATVTTLDRSNRWRTPAGRCRWVSHERQRTPLAPGDRCRRPSPRAPARERGRLPPGRRAFRHRSWRCAEPVSPREDVDEGTELGDVHDLARVDGSDVGLGRLDESGRSACGLRRRPETGPWPDGHEAETSAVRSSDGRCPPPSRLARVLMKLALGSDDLADPVDRDLEGDDLGALSATSGRGPAMTPGHDLEDRQSSVAGLSESLSQDVGRQPVDLGIELEGRDGVARAATLKSMSRRRPRPRGCPSA